MLLKSSVGFRSLRRGFCITNWIPDPRFNFGGSSLNPKNKASRFNNQKSFEFRRLDYPTWGEHQIFLRPCLFIKILHFNLPEHIVMMKVKATMYLIGEQTCFCSIVFIALHFSEHYSATGINWNFITHKACFSLDD